MITLLHGENIVASRKKLSDLKSAYEEVLELNGKTASETDFVQATQSQSMFAAKKLVVIEGIPKFELKVPTCDVVIWEDKKIKNTEGFSALEFKTPASVFTFLNNMTVQNFRTALKDNDVQFIFIMMTRQYRGDKTKLLELDYKNKQGLLPCDFPTAIELFLLGL
jgi:hypothetical protein